MAKTELPKTHYYDMALTLLALENKKWISNKNTYNHWDPETRLWWIKRVEEEAAKGLPMATELVAKALMIRMTNEYTLQSILGDRYFRRLPRSCCRGSIDGPARLFLDMHLFHSVRCPYRNFD